MLNLKIFQKSEYFMHHGYMHHIMDTCIMDKSIMDTCIMDTSAWVTRPERPKGVKDEVRKARRVAD